MAQLVNHAKMGIIFIIQSAYQLALTDILDLSKLVQVFNKIRGEFIWLLKGCPSKCKTCTSASVCKTCNDGFGLLNDECVDCPAGYYLSGGVCESILLKKEKLNNFPKVVNRLVQHAQIAQHANHVIQDHILMARLVEVVQSESFPMKDFVSVRVKFCLTFK